MKKKKMVWIKKLKDWEKREAEMKKLPSLISSKQPTPFKSGSRSAGKERFVVQDQDNLS